jgi:hypothetical protein
MSYADREPKSPEISSLLPAPGWRAFTCVIHDNGKAEIFESPVVGWGVVRKFYRNDGPEDSIELFVFDGNESGVRASDDRQYRDDFDTEIIAPGEAFDDERKEKLEEQTRSLVAARRKRAAKAVA